MSANLDLADKIVHAFQLATGQGPLCAEPLHGVGIAIESVTFPDTTDGSDGAADSAGRLTGEIIKNVKESISQGFLDWSPRILLAMYSCEIQASCEPPCTNQGLMGADMRLL